MSKSIQKKPMQQSKGKKEALKHWTHRVHESIVSAGSDGILNVQVLGGSDNGQFPYLSEIKQEKINYHNGKLYEDDIILEIQGQKVAGYTQHDVIAWLNYCCRNGNPVVLKCIRSGALTKDLRMYLNTRFQKGSVDHDLQNTIRDNLYLRTVPCTTRPRRDSEVHGVDYTFLSVEEFMNLEKSGSLLESGVFEGNHYGTPKPPKEQPSAAPHRSNSSSSILPGAHPSSEGKRRRNRSNVEAMSAKTIDPDPLLNSRSSTPTSASRRHGSTESPPDNLGPLPPNWEMAFTENGDPYFIDHNSGTTHWLDPRMVNIQKKDAAECEEDELPYGWEKIEDPHYGTYYIDHVNRRTQYENPVIQAKRASQQAALNDISGSATFPRIKKEARSSSRRINRHHKPFFTSNPDELQGEFIHTTLVKSSRGFGFTIVGGDEAEEEFLQIKSVVPNGPAYMDGKLQTGDVLVYVNDTCVLGYTHHDVVTMFQSIPVGQTVHLEVCRGYLLPFDPNDPNTEIVTTVAVTMPDSVPTNTSTYANSRSQMIDSYSSERSAKSMPDLSHNESQDSRLQTQLSLDMPSGSENTPDILDIFPAGSKPEFLSVNIVKGNMGFGFTIADSAYGQKVKKILDRPRCKNLMEGDILIEINKVNVRGMTHAEVVQVLKDCPRGQETTIVVQRGGVLVPNKNRNKINSKSPASPSDKAKKFIDLPQDQRSQDVNNRSFMNNRSKTPTGDLTNRSTTPLSQSKSSSNDPQYRPKTPTISTPVRSKTPSDLNHSRGKLPTSSDSQYRSKTPTTELHGKSPNVSYLSHNSTSPPLSHHTSPLAFSHNNLGNEFRGSVREIRNKSPGPIHNRQASHEYHEFHRNFNEQLPGSDPRSRNISASGGSLNNSLEFDSRLAEQSNFQKSSGGDLHSKSPGLEYRSKSPYLDTRPEFETSSSDRNQDKYMYDNRGVEYVRSYMHGNRYPGYSSREPEPTFPDSRNMDYYSRTSNSYSYDEDQIGNDFNRSVYESRSKTSNTFYDRRTSSGPDSQQPPYQSSSPHYNNYTSTQNYNSGYGSGYYRPGVDYGLNSSAPAQSSYGYHSNSSSYYSSPGSNPSQHPRKQSTSFEYEQPSPSNVTRVNQPNDRRNNPLYSSQRGSGGSSRQLEYQEMTVFLQRQENGFGFRIMGGTEEGSQVSIGHIVPGGAADLDGRLQTGDEITYVDGMSVLGVSHHAVVQLMGQAALSGRVNLGVRRKLNSSDSPYHTKSLDNIYPYDVTVTRRENEGFGFIIISSMTRHSSTIGRIIENSPAERCGMLHVGDRILAVNEIDIINMPHGDIVNLIKDSGYSVTLTIGPPQDDVSSTASTSQRALEEEDDQYYAVELHRGTRGFGFSIRGGQEFQNMPLFVLRIADNGPAAQDGRLRVGDQIIEINGNNTKNMTHSEAIEIIKQGGATVRLLVKRGDISTNVTARPTSALSAANGSVGHASPARGENYYLDY